MSSIADYTRDTAYNLFVGCPQALAYSLRDTGKTIVGVAASALSIATLGKIDSVNKYANDYTKRSIYILPDLYKSIIKVINPYTELYTNDNSKCILTEKIAYSIFQYAFSFNNSDSFIKKHLFFRVTMAFGTVVDLVTRVADLALGLVAAAYSIVCSGRIEKLNQFANDQLTVLAIINDICIILRLMINPNQSHCG